MFKRSRKKIILSIMGSLVLLFVITLSVIMIASIHEIRQRNRDMLERYVELFSLEQQPGDETNPAPEPRPFGGEDPGPRQGPMDDRADYQLSTFYSVALAGDEVLAIDDGKKAVYGEDELVSIARDILAGGRSYGTTRHLTFIVAEKPGYTLVAFIDTIVAESGMNTLLHNMLIVGSAALIALFFISLFVAGQIIRPLEENDLQQKRFISDASHELKTPVAVINTNAEMLSREIGPNEWLANIQYENERMSGLIRQLLDLSRAENAEVSMEQVDFSRIVTGETLAFEMLAFDNGKTIQSEIEDGIQLTGNPTQLTQIVSILLDNAIRHSTGDEITVSLRRQAHHALLEVVNEGDEIPPEKQQHLFERFYRVDEARSGDGHHYGLGLSIARAVAEQHKGSIGVSCMDGIVRFTVSIPIRRQA